MPALPDPPGLVVAWWFPATVALPAPVPTTVRRARVYVTTEWVVVYDRRPADGTENPAWFARVDLAATRKPPAGMPLAGAGIDLQTALGLVVVTPEGGCGCSNALKRWQPSWADDTTPWPAQVSS